MVLTVSVSLEKELFFTLDWHDDKIMPQPMVVIIKYNKCFIIKCNIDDCSCLAVYYSHLVMLVNIQQILLIKGAKHHRCKK